MENCRVNDCQKRPLIGVLTEALVEMKHAAIFIRSREKMHPIGVKQFDQVVEQIEAALAPQKGNTGP